MFDRSDGHAVLMQGSARYPMPHNPSGWYKVLYSDELAVGELVQRLQRLRRDAVVAQ